MQPERYAVIGDPIGHSLSPAMQTAAIRQGGIDATYTSVHVKSGELPSFVNRIRRGEFQGINVTIPHKTDICSRLDYLDEDAAHLGAVNTVVVHDGRLYGHNTDVEGFRLLMQALPAPARRGHAVIIGTGGAARAVARALQTSAQGAVLVSRDPERARTLQESGFGDADVRHIDALPDLLQSPACTLLINATPKGMPPLEDATALPDAAPLRDTIAVVDLIYGRRTPLLARAAAEGCFVLDGLEMLIRQGAAAFRLWFGQEPDIDAMRRAVQFTPMEERRCSAS